MTDENELIEGIANMMREALASRDEKIEALTARVTGLEMQLAPPEDTGLPNPRGIQYMALSYFDNSAEMMRGKGRHVLKIEANKTRKPGTIRFDYALTAYLFDYDRFMKNIKMGSLDETIEASDAIRKKLAPLRLVDNLMFGCIRKQGGKQGTSVFADQICVVGVENGIAISACILVGDETYQTKAEWITADPKTGQPFKAANIKSKCICFPHDELEDDGDAE